MHFVLVQPLGSAGEVGKGVKSGQAPQHRGGDDPSTKEAQIERAEPCGEIIIDRVTKSRRIEEGEAPDQDNVDQVLPNKSPRLEQSQIIAPVLGSRDGFSGKVLG